MGTILRAAVLIGTAAAMLAPLPAAAAAPAVSSGSGRATVFGRATASGGTWGNAEQVPGLAALSTGPGATTATVSCASAGNCSAGGSYTGVTGIDGDTQAFVVSEANGTWGKAKEVPGTAALNQGGNAAVVSVSCASAGNCSGGGSYTDGTGVDGHPQAFVVSQANGTWGKAEEVPGTATLNQVAASVTAVSCPAAGDCGAGGFYLNSSTRAFVVSQKNGTWGKAEQMPGTAALGEGNNFNNLSTVVSCGSAGNCSAAHSFADSSGHTQAFISNQINGTWRAAIEAPGLAALNKGGNAEINSISCASAGNCSAGGDYRDGSGHTQAFVAGETNGTWRAAIEVPGTAALNLGGNATLGSVSCASAGNCGAGGFYTDSSGHTQAFVVGEANGIWGKARDVPGIAALNLGGNAGLGSVSCALPGNCGAGGFYTDGSGHMQAFVVGETSGVWGKAQEVPGTAALNQNGRASVSALSCASAGHCSAGGFYDGPGAGAFVVSEK
jgi:hypothetical protein